MVMEVIYLNENSNYELKESCVALGFFDGMHLGHQKLVATVVKISKQKNLKKALLTFDVHPKSYLKNIEFKELMSLTDKINFLQKYDFDYLFVLKFSHQIANMAPIDFINDYIVKAKIKHVICGFDFHFGKNGKGNYQYLIENQQNNYEVTVIQKQEYQHHKISSSYLKMALSDGNVELASKLLGHNYSVSGKIIHGLKNGRKIGFPTINIDTKNYVLPKNGVYGVLVEIEGQMYVGMANIGYNPTFNVLTKVSLEVNVFDFNQDVYDKNALVYFIKRIRCEKKFASVNDLVLQLQKDCRQIKEEIKLIKDV